MAENDQSQEPLTQDDAAALKVVKAYVQYKNTLKDLRSRFLTPEYVINDTPILELSDGLVYAVFEGPPSEERKPLLGRNLKTEYRRRKFIGVRTASNPETISREQSGLLEPFWLTRPLDDNVVKAWTSIDDVWNRSRNEAKETGVSDDQIHDKTSKKIIDIFAPKSKYVRLPWIPSKRIALPSVVMFAYKREREKAEVDQKPSIFFVKDYKTHTLIAAGLTLVAKPMFDFKSGKVKSPTVIYTYEQATDAWNKHIDEITRGYYEDSDMSLPHEAIKVVYLGLSAIIPPEYFAWYAQYHKDFFDYLSEQYNKKQNRLSRVE